VNAIDLGPRSESCLSDLKLDRLLAGELDGRPEEEAARAHIASCPRCQQRRDDIAAQPAQTPGPALIREVSQRGAPQRRAPRRRAPVVAAISLLAAAAGVVLFARPRPGPPAPAETRLKGGDLGFEVLVRRQGEGSAATLRPELPLHPGDVIGFRVRSRAGGHLAIVSIGGSDGAANVSSYLPGPAGTMPLLPPGERMVGGSVRLDGTLGRETLVAVLCTDEADAARTLAAARAAAAQAQGGGALPRLELPCEQARAVFVKEAPR
jgi:hypothetical protein